METEQINAFIKDKIVPIFDGMVAEDVMEIIAALRRHEALFAEFTLSSKKP